MLHEQIIECRGIAAVFVAGFVEPIDHDPVQPEDTGIGYTEFFDWLAGCSDAELWLLDTGGRSRIDGVKLTAKQRYDIGLRIWQAM